MPKKNLLHFFTIFSENFVLIFDILITPLDLEGTIIHSFT